MPIKNFQLYKINDFLLILFLIFLLNTFFLFYKTFIDYSVELNLIETIRFFLPIFLTFIFAFIKKNDQLLLIDIFLLIFIFHFFTALFISTIIAEDGRLLIRFIGRGANEAGFAITSLTICSFHKRLKNFFFSNLLFRYVIYLLTIIIIFGSQSRSSLVYLLIFLFCFYRYEIFKVFLKNKYFILFLSLYTLFFGIEFINRFLAIIKNEEFFYFFSGRIDIWSSFIQYLLNLNFTQILFGNNLSTNAIYVVSYGGLLSDAHNLYIDLLVQLGTVITLIFFISLLLKIKFDNFKLSLLFAFLAFNFLNDSFRFVYLLYVNILIIFLLLSNE